MLSSADAALVDRDPGLAGLALLLDGRALADRRGAPVRRRYLRYKAGTSCVLALDVVGESCFAVAYAAHTDGKLDKSVAAAPDGSLLLVDAGLGLLVARPSADRDLPALERLDLDLPAALALALPGRDLRAASLHQLSHKPQRRWVGRLDVPGDAPVVLRVHRPDDARKTVRAVRVLDGHTAWTPSLLGSDRRLGVVAVTWVPGTGLHELLARGTARTEHVRAAGAALAELHGGPLDGLRRRTAEDDVADARRAAGAVARLLPRLDAPSAALAGRLAELLRTGQEPPVAAHGDLSADLVVVTEDGRTGLVDLDAATAAEPSLDLGSALAALHAAAVLGTGPQAVAAPSSRSGCAARDGRARSSSCSTSLSRFAPYRRVHQSLTDVAKVATGQGLSLRRAWPRSPDHLLLDLVPDAGSAVAGQWLADADRAAQVAARTGPPASVHGHAYAKVVRPERVADVAWTARAAMASGARVPEVLDVDEAAGIVTAAALPGGTLHDLLGGGSPDTVPAVRSGARWLRCTPRRCRQGPACTTVLPSSRFSSAGRS